jgi:hypothetical protein
MKMSKFKRKTAVVDAVRWIRNGDHPRDASELVVPDPRSMTQFAPFLSEGKVVRYFRNPYILDGSLCDLCGMRHIEHGWIDSGDEGQKVCPGDWVITEADGRVHSCNSGEFLVEYLCTSL